MTEPLPDMPEPEYKSAADWTMQMEVGGEVYPFVADEDGNITGFSHQDRAEFAAAINRYEAVECGNDDDLWTADDIGHDWMAPDEDSDEYFHVCTPDAPGAIPVTTLWGKR